MNMSPMVDALLSTFEEEKVPAKENSVISVSKTVSILARIYEKARNAVEFRAEHLVRRAAIERILKRRIMLNGSSESIAENLVLELLWAKYLDSGLIGDEKFNLHSLRGKVVLVDFWGTWCGPCRLLNPQLKKMYDQYHHDGFEIVGVHTADGSEEMADYLKDRNILWPNIIDQDDVFMKSYAVPHFPSLYLIDREGILRVALLHTAGLDDAVASMLHVKAKVPE